MKTSHLVIGAVGVFFALGTLGPAASRWAGQQAGHAADGAITATATGVITGAGDLCAGQNAVLCAALPMNPAQDAANLAGVYARTGATVPTTTPPPAQPTPYGPPNGPVRALPGPTPQLPPAPPKSGGDEPVLEGGAGDGGILGSLPVIGGAIKELGPGVIQALNP